MSYSDSIIRYYRASEWRGALEGGSVCHARVRNASCGDELTIYLDVQDGVILTACYTGMGCVLSQASAALLCSWSTDKTVAQCLQICPEDLLGYIGMPLGPVRARCALMSLQALRQALEGRLYHIAN